MEHGCYRFGLFEFDTEKLELRRQGTLIHLQSQPSRALACLIENADRTVSREELCKAVWGDDTFVDFERGLNFCITQVRSALEDDHARPIYIQTFPKRGYQFIAPVRCISGDAGPQDPRSVAATSDVGKRRVVQAGVAAAVLTVVSLAAAYWLGLRTDPKPPPVVAIVRFDNETGNPEITRFSDALTDNVVERLTTLSDGRYGVIGNDRVLRLPREQRDLNTISVSLHANYVVLGQVQSNGSQVRILAHLIRMPEQTHVKVVRMDRMLKDPLTLESEVAQEIANQFSTRVAANDLHSASSSVANH